MTMPILPIVPSMPGVPSMPSMPIVLRMARESDAPALSAIYAPYVLDTIISFEMVPPTTEEMAARLTKTLARFPWLVAESGAIDESAETGDANREIVGYAYAGGHNERAAYQWSADVSVYLHNDWHGRGIGRRLYNALFALLRAQGYHNVFGGITLPNPASVGLHEAMGMRPVGVYHHVGYKAGAWHDVGWWEGPLQPLVPNPQPPCAILELAPLAAWDAWLATGDLALPVPQTQP